MQDLLAELFWDPGKIGEGADQLCKTLPGYQEAKQQYEETIETIRGIVGYELYDQFLTQLIQYTNYEVYSYYFFGLGLRKDLVEALRI